MTSWAVVCDVWYLEPQNMKPGETAIEFAERYVALSNGIKHFILFGNVMDMYFLGIRTISYLGIAFVKFKFSYAGLGT